MSDFSDDRYQRVSDFENNPEKYSVIDGIDCRDDVMTLGNVVSFAPELLSDSEYAVKARKIIRRKFDNFDYEHWREWCRKVNFFETALTLSPHTWLGVLSGIAFISVHHDEDIERNKLWKNASSRDRNNDIQSAITKTRALSYALKKGNLPEIPMLYNFLSCGNPMFSSKHHNELNNFCEKYGVKPIYKETMFDVLDRFEEYLVNKAKEYKGTSIKGDRDERAYAKWIFKALHTDLFREKTRPITLITLLVNIKYNKNYGNEKIKNWIK